MRRMKSLASLRECHESRGGGGIVRVVPNIACAAAALDVVSGADEAGEGAVLGWSAPAVGLPRGVLGES